MIPIIKLLYAAKRFDNTIEERIIMREIKRIDRMLAEIRKIWYTFPDWRLMQTLCDVIQSHSDSFYLEDEELEKLLQKFIEENC